MWVLISKFVFFYLVPSEKDADYSVGSDEEVDFEDEEDETSCEDTALLGATRMQIIVTPSVSPGQSASDLTLVEQSREMDFHDPHSHS